MKKKFAALVQIEHEQELTMENACTFLYYLQNSLLLALQEQGGLNAIQYRHAAEKLSSQRREFAKKLKQKGERQ